MSVSLLIRRVECIISLDRIFASTQGGWRPLLFCWFIIYILLIKKINIFLAN